MQRQLDKCEPFARSMSHRALPYWLHAKLRMSKNESAPQNERIRALTGMSVPALYWVDLGLAWAPRAQWSDRCGYHSCEQDHAHVDCMGHMQEDIDQYLCTGSSPLMKLPCVVALLVKETRLAQLQSCTSEHRNICRNRKQILRAAGVMHLE